MKKILFMVVGILLVIGLAGAGTWAYFSDTETSTGNTFIAGTLDFNIIDPVATGHQVFTVTNMKPGDTETGYLVVTNDGSLDMKWRAWLDEDTTGILDEVLEVRWTINPTGYSGVDLTGYTSAGPADGLIMDWTSISDLTGQTTTKMLWASPTDNPAGGAVAFEPAWAAVYKMDVRMVTTAGDIYQGTTYTGVLNFYATQYEMSGWPTGF